MVSSASSSSSSTSPGEGVGVDGDVLHPRLRHRPERLLVDRKFLQLVQRLQAVDDPSWLGWDEKTWDSEERGIRFVIVSVEVQRCFCTISQCCGIVNCIIVYCRRLGNMETCIMIIRGNCTQYINKYHNMPLDSKHGYKQCRLGWLNMDMNYKPGYHDMTLSQFHGETTIQRH